MFKGKDVKKSIEPGNRPMVLLGQVLDTHELALYSIGLVKADLRLFNFRFRYELSKATHAYDAQFS